MVALPSLSEKINQKNMDKNEIRDKIDTLKKEKTRIFKPDGTEIKIPKEGSLGLLAIGYKGILAWRKKMKS